MSLDSNLAHLESLGFELVSKSEDRVIARKSDWQFLTRMFYLIQIRRISNLSADDIASDRAILEDQAYRVGPILHSPWITEGSNNDCGVLRANCGTPSSGSHYLASSGGLCAHLCVRRVGGVHSEQTHVGANSALGSHLLQAHSQARCYPPRIVTLSLLLAVSTCRIPLCVQSPSSISYLAGWHYMLHGVALRLRHCA